MGGGAIAIQHAESKEYKGGITDGRRQRGGRSGDIYPIGKLLRFDLSFTVRLGND